MRAGESMALSDRAAELHTKVQRGKTPKLQNAGFLPKLCHVMVQRQQITSYVVLLQDLTITGSRHRRIFLIHLPGMNLLRHGKEVITRKNNPFLLI